MHYHTYKWKYLVNNLEMATAARCVWLICRIERSRRGCTRLVSSNARWPLVAHNQSFAANSHGHYYCPTVACLNNFWLWSCVWSNISNHTPVGCMFTDKQDLRLSRPTGQLANVSATAWPTDSPITWFFNTKASTKVGPRATIRARTHRLTVQAPLEVARFENLRPIKSVEIFNLRSDQQL